MLKTHSLSFRIILASLVLLPILLSFSAYMLDRAFQRSLYTAEQEALVAQIYALLGATDPGEESLEAPTRLSDPRFSTPDSGLYALILDGDNHVVWQSDSLALSPWEEDSNVAGHIPIIQSGDKDFFEFTLNNKVHFVFSLGTIWEFDFGEQLFQFTVIHTKEQIKKEIVSYRKTLWMWLAGLACLLIVIQTVVMRWGLAPLKSLAFQIKQLESGDLHQLEGRYPEEISPVTSNINLLLASEKSQRERYKNTLGDLAHSLKTPLAIIRSQFEHSKGSQQGTSINDLYSTVDEQIERMSDIVQHQLNRASSNIKKTYSSSVDISVIFSRLVSALGKVYREKNVSAENKMPDNLMLLGEEDDFMELFGNILENAFKYCHQQVRVTAINDGKFTTVCIEDDGEGIQPELQEMVLNRGARLDTTKPGQGIGLTVALDILSSYDGALKIEQSDLGGARFVLSFSTPNI